MTFDGKAFGAEIVDVVKGYLDKKLGPLTARVESIEKFGKSIEDMWERVIDLEDRLSAIDGQKAAKPRVRVKSSTAHHFKSEDDYRQWLKETTA